MNIAIMQLLDELGLARAGTQTVIPDPRRGFDVRTDWRHWQTRAADVRPVQPNPIKVNLDHTPTVVGQLIHLEHPTRRGIWAVAELPGDEIDPDRLPVFYASVETDSNRDGTDVVITGVGLVEQTAQTCTQPIRIMAGDIAHPEVRRRWARTLAPFEQRIVEHAADTARARRQLRDDASLLVYDERLEKWRETESRRNNQVWEQSTGQARDAMFRRPAGRIQHSAPVRNSVISVR